MFDKSGRLLVTLSRVDRIVDADGDTYALAAEDYLDFFAAGTRYARIDTNGLLLTEYLRHYGDLDTHLRFDTDRLRVEVGGADIFDIIPGAVVWNEAGADIDHRWEGVGAPNAVCIQGSDGKFGLGTPTIPHGGIGIAILALDGANANAAGPHVQFTTASDDYPLMQFRNWSHDNIGIYLDSYYVAGQAYSSDVGSNFIIRKSGDLFIIQYDSGIAQGNILTPNNGIALDTSGVVTLSGFSSLGTGNTAVKVKKLTGTTNAAEGGNTGIAHGLTSSKIIGISVLVFNSATNAIMPVYTLAAGYYYYWHLDATDVVITNHATESENILSKDIVITIIYEA